MTCSRLWGSTYYNRVPRSLKHNKVHQVGLLPEHLLREVLVTHPAVGAVVPVLPDVIDVIIPPLEEQLAILRAVLIGEVLFELFRRPPWPTSFH